MGKITDSILSGTRGRTGRIVVTYVNGVEISRMRPRRNDRKASPKQQLIQERFNWATRFIQGYKSFVKFYYGKKNGLKSTYNQAMGSLLQAVSCNMTLLEFEIDYDKIQFSKGNLLQPQPLSISSEEPSSFTLNWLNNAMYEDEENDTLVILYAEDGIDKSQSFLMQTNVKRSSETYQMEVLPKFQGEFLHVWMSFISENNQDASNSVYVGKIQIT